MVLCPFITLHGLFLMWPSYQPSLCFPFPYYAKTYVKNRYYGNGNTAKLAQCYDVNLLDSYIHDAVDFQGTAEALQPQANVWLGETSSFYDGGAPRLSDTYVAGFM
jgi:hypothetical protein